MSINLQVLNPMGWVALQEKTLIITALLLMLIVVVPVIIMTLSFAWRYRQSNKNAVYKPHWEHNVWLEVVWWAIPCFIIGILATITWFSTHKLDPYRKLDSDKAPINIQVIALDWKWLFVYPDYNIASVNFLQIPIETPINFDITSDAPMNSFSIPQLGGQIYAMQGMKTKLHLIASESGDFNGFSSNYSGEGFSGMKFIARASSNDDFNAWIKSVKASHKVLTAQEYSALSTPSMNNKTEVFSGAEKDLYESVVMKYMSDEHGHQS